jgi:predicted phosphodiesterase
MKNRYIIIVVCVGLLVYSSYLYRTKSQYPVYCGEELLKTSTYPYTFVFFGDNRPAEGSKQPEIFKTVLEMVGNEDPLFVIGGGDFVVEGTPENFETFLETVSALNPHLFYVCGNHDDSVYYEEYLGERVYAFTYQNAIFIILDNSRNVLDENQLKFLENQLEKEYEYAFVFMHVPPFDPEGSYCMIHPEEFMEIVLKYEVDYVFCSHIHCFYEETKNNTVFIISGGAGAPLYREGYNHYIVVNVGDEITYDVVRV